MDLQGVAGRVEEGQVEVEAHAKGVDAGAARDQQTIADPLAWQAGEPEQAGARVAGDGDGEAADAVLGKPAQPGGEHGSVKGRGGPIRPPQVQPPVQPLPQTGTGVR